jgi:hypothetical protein
LIVAPRCVTALTFVAIVFASAVPPASAQDLEPRAYAAAPVGLRFLLVATGRSSGGVLVDPSLPIEDAHATVNSLIVGTGVTVNLFGRTALAVAAVPYAWVSASGSVGETTRTASRSGLADPRFKLSVNLLGGRALTAREFASARRPTIVGLSMTLGPPLGRYQPAKLVNIGANRWSFKPELGVSHAIGRWTVEGYGGVWLFSPNDDFYTGASVRTQKPVVALQAHASYTVRPRLWLALNGTWYSGGTTTVDGREKGDLQRNSRLGATVSLPVTRQQSLKVTASTGATTRSGADFQTIGVAWQLSWMK